MTSINYLALQPKTEEWQACNRFLKQNKQQTAGKLERLWGIQKGGDFIGAVRLIPCGTLHPLPNAEKRLDDANSDAHGYWIRNLYIDARHRHQGLASQLLLEIKAFLQTSETIQANKAFLFAFIEAELTPFYRQNGFQPINREQLPPLLRQRYDHYLNHGQAFQAWALLF